MNLQYFLGYGLPAVVLAVLLAGVFIISRRSRRKAAQKAEENRRQGKLRTQTGAAIVETVRTNNSVPCLENTFENLLRSLDANGLVLNTDLRGYTTDAE